MEMEFSEQVYCCLLGVVREDCRIQDVENLFAPGKLCMERYGNMRDAYDRLCQRLGETDEDKDAEQMLQALLDIQRELCLRMYHYGQLFGRL